MNIKVYLLAIVLSFPATLYAQVDTEKSNTVTLTPSGSAVLEWDEDVFDFGKITQGDIVEHKFTFTNTGNAPLIITEVTRSCGCTTPTYSKEPIAPGGKGEILVQFRSAGKRGVQVKTVRVHYNGEASTALVTIKSNVQVP